MYTPKAKHMCVGGGCGMRRGAGPLAVVVYSCLLVLAAAQSIDTEGGITRFVPASTEGDIKNIIVDEKNDRVYFASGDRLYRLSGDLKTDVLEEVWKGSNTSKINCKKRDKCINMITIMELDLRNNIFTCGTNAKPACVTFDKNTLKKTSEVIDGYFQHSPRTSDTTVVTLFLAPYMFIGMREKGEQGKLLKLKPYGQKILATTKESKIFEGFHPDFVSAYSYDNYAYFFLREYGYEQQKRKVRYSRIARVCKHDSGVKKYGLSNFITMLKTRLQCNKNTLYFDQLRSTFEVKANNAAGESDTFIYGVFSLPNNEMGSAICRYRVKDIQKVFSTSDLYQKESDGQMKKTQFTPFIQRITRSSCGANSTSTKIGMREVKQLDGAQLLYDDVTPHTGNALFSLPGVTFTSVVVHQHKPSLNNIVFAGTSKGQVYKILVKDNSDDNRVLGEPVQLFDSGTTITSMRKMGEKVYAGSTDGVAVFRVDTCEWYRTRNCMDCYRDPYCIWDVAENKCVGAATVSNGLVVEESEMEQNCEAVHLSTTSETPLATTTTVQDTTSPDHKPTTTQPTTKAVKPTSTPPTTPSITDKMLTTKTSSSSSSSTSASSSSSTPQVVPVNTTAQAAAKDRSTKSPDRDASRSDDSRKSYYTEFITMTILFVLILILLTLLLLKVAQARYRDTIDGEDVHARKGCQAFCPSSLSKHYMDQSSKKLMQQNPVYKDTTVELNDVTNHHRVNGKIT